MKTGFFYSKTTGMYISRKPLKIDSRVKIAAEKTYLKIDWDDEGRINFIDFETARKLLDSLNSQMLSPIEYWQVLNDAENEDTDMFHELTSKEYAEWLDRVYLRKGTFIDHPKIISQYKYSGKETKAIYPKGTPGWFNPENNVDKKTGVPKKVELFREKHAVSWKYWDPTLGLAASELDATAPIRGYVTSVGKPSFDMGIPVDAKQPMMMIRECRKIPLESPVPKEALSEAQEILNYYSEVNENIREEKIYEILFKQKEKITAFIEKNSKYFDKTKEPDIYKIREQLFNILGLLKVLVLSKNLSTEKIDGSASKLSGKKGTVSYQDFFEFVKTSKERLKKTVEQKKDIIFVMGHKNPDTDAVISSLFEAYRNHLFDKETVYIPLIQNHKVPDEIKKLLEEISEHILLSTDELYLVVKKTGLARWISVDQNREPEVQKYFTSIIDHHIVCETAKNQDLPKTLEMIGSCSALITKKILGMGLSIDQKLARILHGATLMDTENRVFHKMTFQDELIMNYLKKKSETKNEDEFYSNLMSQLLNTDDPEVLFKRDYKEDWGFGFAVAKIKNGLDKEGNVLKKELVSKAVKLAEQNNIDKNLPLTIFKITDYNEDNRTVNRERVYLVFNKQSSKEFITSIFELVKEIVNFEFGKVQVREEENFIEFWGTGMQLSRKKTAPVLEPVVKSFNEYFYSSTLDLWVKRDFLKKTKETRDAAKKVKIKLSSDEENRVNYITYPEAKKLVKELKYSMLSTKKYWSVLNDAKKMKDVQMIESMQGLNFVEFWDTVLEKGSIIEHPEIKNGELIGERKKVKIQWGKPGLFHPDEIDLKTGFPKKVRKPNEYGNPELWRYWEPDAELVTPTRSYIFLLKQPCWDGKFHINDSLPNLGIRPCSNKLIKPEITIEFDQKVLKITIKKEGDHIKYSWKK
ncbi:DHH family phosphoesterase [archaeon]|nr:DHH family phosphoesterase [archaeon]